MNKPMKTMLKPFKHFVRASCARLFSTARKAWGKCRFTINSVHNTYSRLLNWTHVGILLGMVMTYTPWWFLLDVIFHFCPPMGTIKTMVFHLSTSWVLLGPWFSVFPENSQAGSTVQKHIWYYWDHGFSFKPPWVLLGPWFSVYPTCEYY